MKSNIVNYINGYVKIRIYGKMPEKFINLCIVNYILLWNIHKEPGDSFSATMRLDDFFKIRSLVLKSNTHICVIGYGGVPFIIKKLKRRKMLVMGALLFVVLLNVLSSYIWFVDIIGVKQLSTNHIKDIAYQYGLKPGMNKNSVDIKALENKMILDIPEISWIGIGFNGTRATIEIVEKTMPKLEDKLPADIIASKDGVIMELIALAGQPVVKIGDTVRKGDVLIKGVVPPVVNSTNPDQPKFIIPPSQPQPVKAVGIVKAKVWYESYGEEPIKNIIYHRTGKQCIGLTVRLGEHESVLKKAPDNPYDAFEVEVIHKNLPYWRNSVFAVESIINIYHELSAVVEEISPEEARDKAKNNAFLVLQNFIPESAYVLTRNTEVLKTSETNLMRIKINIETIEDIGQTSPVSSR